MFKMFFKKKKNYINFFYSFIGFFHLFGLILVCSGSKSCPESTRPHLTRCDKYFRCTQLPNKTFVWIPAQCDKGLVYEPSLKICVLPGDNWECNLTEELTNHQILNDENNVYGVNNILMSDYSIEEITLNDENSTLFGDESSEITDSSELYIETTSAPGNFNSSVEDEDEYESSGDANFTPETKEYIINNNHISIPESIDFDNKLTSHLQRLTQLIDSIKNQNNTNDTTNELMADQLNHFLDNYNLMTQQIYDGNNTNKITIPEDGHMHPDHIEEIISQQNKLTIDDVVKQMIQTRINDVSVLYPIKEPNVNIKLNSEPHQIKKGYRQPEVKIPHSQIIINRPGGSVLFNIDSNNKHERVSSHTVSKEEPLISEETLKTVLELSKQLVQNQNSNRQVYPIYYTVPIPIISNQKETANKRFDKEPPISVTNSFNTYGEDTRDRHGTISSGNHDGGNNISTTVIFDDHSLPSKWNIYHNKYKPIPHKIHGSHDTQLYQTPNTDSDIFPTYYHPSYTEFDSYQPSYYPQYHSNNPYKNPSSYYQDPLDLYPPYLTPFYNPGSITTATTPIPTTTTTTTTTERYANQETDDDMYTDDDVSGTGNIALPPISYYNPLVANLGLLQMNDDNQDKLINFGGNYISYNSYKNTLLPLLQPSTLGGGLEILTCSRGTRQPNMTDCSRYYVCNPKTQNVLSYACPPFTAFNKGTKICDAKSYAVCKPEAIMNRYTVAENMRLQQEAQKALAEAQKLRNDVLKSSALASILQSPSTGSSATMDSSPIKMVQTNLGAGVPNQNLQTKKRRVRCYDTGKISDPDSSRNYWVCFRGSNGRMKRQKMTCASGLIFCKSTRYCTLSKKC